MNTAGRLKVADSHAHLDMLDDPAGAVRRAGEAGVELIVCVGDGVQSSRQCIALAEAHAGVYASVGLHPHSAEEWSDGLGRELAELARHTCVVAVGETGLDFYRNYSPREAQAECFRRQLSLAGELGLPAIVHVRDAHKEAMDTLSSGARPDTVIIHCFSGTPRDALEYVDLGCYLSFSGTVTFPGADELREAARVVPRDKLLVETDTPYLSPQPVRGRRNEPANVVFTVQFLAEVLGENLSFLSERLWANTLAAFST